MGVRPSVPAGWRKHGGLAVLCETIEGCWDHDAEARPSSSCVVERLQQMRLVSAGSFPPAPLSLPTLPPRSPSARASPPRNDGRLLSKSVSKSQRLALSPSMSETLAQV